MRMYLYIFIIFTQRKAGFVLACFLNLGPGSGIHSSSNVWTPDSIFSRIDLKKKIQFFSSFYSKEVPSDWNGDLTCTRLLSGVLLACAAEVELCSLLHHSHQESVTPSQNTCPPGKTSGSAKLVLLFAIFGSVEGIVRSSQLLFINIGCYWCCLFIWRSTKE